MCNYLNLKSKMHNYFRKEVPATWITDEKKSSDGYEGKEVPFKEFLRKKRTKDSNLSFRWQEL